MSPLKLALPKGRLQAGVYALLADAGIRVSTSSRGYRPELSLAGVEAKLLKARNVVEMLQHGSRDVGFSGADWVAEARADVVELLDTGLDEVRLVAAAPVGVLADGRLPRRELRVATEYVNLARGWAERRELRAKVFRTFGATEVFPPEDADCIVDNASSGDTLRANRLVVVEELMRSTTRMYASRAAHDDPARRAQIEDLVMLLRAVLEARRRVMLEINVGADTLAAVIDVLPCMKRPTVSPLFGEAGFAVKAAVLRSQLPVLIPRIKTLGATDLVVSAPEQIVP